MDDAQNENDWLENYRRSLLERNSRELYARRQSIEDFRQYCQGFGIALEETQFEYIPAIGVVAIHPNLLEVLNPELRRDKEGLVDCVQLLDHYTKSDINPGYLYAEKYMAMLSSVFRRGMNGGANWAPRFVDEYWRLDDPGIRSHILLDFDRVRVNVDNTCYFEEEAWYGAPFREAICSIADGCTYFRPPLDLEPRFVAILFNSTYSLEILWSTKGRYRTFQALEFKSDGTTIERNGQHVHPARYLHAEYDVEAESFVHFDGAVQYYAHADYLKRRGPDYQQEVNQGRRIKAASEKAFKFDGRIPVEVWVRLCSHYCTGNPLVIEYFSGTYPQHIVDALDRMKQCRDGVT